MSTLLEGYLRTYRKRFGLSQSHVAFLIGSANDNNVSRHELHSRMPDLRTAFAYEVIFRTPLRQLFSGLYQKVEKETIARARELAQRIAGARMPRQYLALLEYLASEPTPPRPEAR